MNLITENENIIIFEVDKKVKLEEFLTSKDISGRLFRKLYKAKSIFINDEFQRKGLHLNKGDRVKIIMEDEIDNTPPIKMDLDIIYEDHDLLIINKAPYMVVHQTKSHQEDTLSNGIAYYFRENNIRKKIRFVNRLDMNTSGILIVAKNPFAHQQVALQFENKTVIKRYKALLAGIVEKDSAYIDLPISREEEKSIKKQVSNLGQEALTKYKVLERYENATLVDIQIFTGRSHQIRVHMNHIGHPVIGDSLYGEENPHINRQALHSYYLKLKHPRTNKDLEFQASLPKDMEDLIERL